MRAFSCSLLWGGGRRTLSGGPWPQLGVAWRHLGRGGYGRSVTPYADPKLCCDIVMKGGITSGVVYPGAVLKLAPLYRFKSIGGASAGGIAPPSRPPPSTRASTRASPSR